MTFRADLRAYLTAHPGASLDDVAAALPAKSRKRITTELAHMKKACQVKRYGEAWSLVPGWAPKRSGRARGDGLAPLPERMIGNRAKLRQEKRAARANGGTVRSMRDLATKLVARDHDRVLVLPLTLTEHARATFELLRVCLGDVALSEAASKAMVIHAQAMALLARE